MNIAKNNKGVVRVIESIIAAALLMGCLAMVPAQQSPQNTNSNLSALGQNALLILDSNSHLSNLVESADWIDLQSSIASALPLTVWFNLTVFDRNMNPLNSFPICNSGVTSNKIASVDYICASQNSAYEVYTLQLQLSEVGAT